MLLQYGLVSNERLWSYLYTPLEDLPSEAAHILYNASLQSLAGNGTDQWTAKKKCINTRPSHNVNKKEM